jgi:hypothetical protein
VRLALKKKKGFTDMYITEKIERYLNEAAVTELVDGWTAKFRKWSDGQFDLILTNKKTQELYVCYDCAWYREGWSQGTQRSEKGYYLETVFGYGDGNGSGKSSKSIPVIKYVGNGHLVDFLKNVVKNKKFTGSSSNGKWEFEKKDYKVDYK